MCVFNPLSVLNGSDMCWKRYSTLNAHPSFHNVVIDACSGLKNSSKMRISDLLCFSATAVVTTPSPSEDQERASVLLDGFERKTQLYLAVLLPVRTRGK